MNTASAARTSTMVGSALPALMTAVAVLLAGAVALPLLNPGPLSAHMAAHIALMNGVAPLAAVGLAHMGRNVPAMPRFVWVAGGVQLLLLWAWHAPSVQILLVHGSGLPLIMHASLFAASLAFWFCLIRLTGHSRWHGVAALLVTGKLACLLAALFVFAPAPVFSGHQGTPVALDDQQLAGLLMITACPLSYVLGGVVLAAQILNDATTVQSLRRTAAE